VRSELSDFSQQLFALLRSRNTARYPTEIQEIDQNQLLHDIAIDGRQRVDVVDRILQYMSTSQDTHRSENPYVDKSITAFPQEYFEGNSRWNHLRQAVKGSNEKIVRLFLERGVRTNAVAKDTFHWAVRTGCLSSVRLLVDHGADINGIAQWPTDPRLGRNPMAPIVEAICLEQESMARYLHERGATLAFTLDDAREAPTRLALQQYPDSKWRLAQLLARCERKEEHCGGQCK
jgi:hypothetical protein